MNASQLPIRGFAQGEVQELNENLRDTADAMREIGAKLDEIHSAPATPPAKDPPPPGDKPPAPAPGQTPGAACPLAGGLPQHWIAAPAMPGGGVQLPLPAVPDYGPQLAEFVATVIRNQETMLRTIEQALDICRRHEQEIQDLARRVACMPRYA